MAQVWGRKEIRHFVRRVAATLGVDRELRLCARCGAENWGDFQFCGSCGAILGRPAPPIDALNVVYLAYLGAGFALLVYGIFQFAFGNPFVALLKALAGGYCIYKGLRMS